jgi:hypothetical protein
LQQNRENEGNSGQARGQIDRYDAPNRDFDLSVRASDAVGNSDVETIRVADGSYRAPRRKADGSDADTIGA